MKKIPLLLIVLILFQSCYSYKKMAINDLQVDQRYEMRVNNETNVRGICHSITADSLEFRVKHRLLKYSKSDVNDVKRRKVSALKSVGLFGVLATAAVLSVTTNDIPSAFSQTRPRSGIRE